MLENRQKHEELGAQIRHGEAVTHSNKSAERIIAFCFKLLCFSQS